MNADQMSLAVRTEITRRIPGIIESADLEKCTVKILQRQLEEGLKRDLGEHTDFIRLTVRDDDGFDDDDAIMACDLAYQLWKPEDAYMGRGENNGKRRR